MRFLDREMPLITPNGHMKKSELFSYILGHTPRAIRIAIAIMITITITLWYY